MIKISHKEISIQEAEDLLFTLYGMKGKASKLPGYADFNFRIKVDKGDGYVLKISRPYANEDTVSFLRDILLYLEQEAQDILTPKIYPDKNGNYISEVEDNAENKRSIRLLSWITGRIWHQVNPRLNQLHFSLGETCGKITKAFSDMSGLYPKPPKV